MLASKMINRLQKLIDKHGDFQVDMLSLIIEDEQIIGEKLIPIRQIKYRKKLNRFFTDFTGRF
jgi:hypothetical protein